MDRRTFLKKAGETGLLFGLGGFQILSPACHKSYDFDLIVKGGSIFDGSSEAAFTADLGIKNKRILAIGNLQEFTAYRVLDVDGLTVAPGFIDVHTHTDRRILVNPRAESKIRQGVTTEILGQDGGSMAPLTEEMRVARHKRYQERYGLSVDWHDFEGYFQAVTRQGTAVNLGSMVGQGTLRRCVLGMVDRKPSSEELAQIQELARQALDQGVLGISSGLEYTPGGFASTEEITELCSVMQGTSGLYATHIRNEDDGVVGAVAEAIAIAKGAGVGLHISHLKCQGQRNWSKLDEIFALIDQAQSESFSVTFDRYPYVAYSTGLASLMPIWSREGGTEKFIERLNNPEVLSKIKAATLNKIQLLGSWDSVMITSVSLEKNKAYQGKTVAEIVAGTNQDGFEFTRSLIIEERNRVGMVGFGMSEENTARILSHPKCMPASDGSALATYGPLSEGNPHPRSYGTFPRVLSKYVREQNAMSLAEAIRKMTSLPAQRFGLVDRGQIATKFMADLVVFDPQTIQDRATFSEPHQYPTGIEFVLVNGEVVIEKGAHSGNLPGMILKGRFSGKGA
ncbi:MAG: amidohydrolase family protein [bacterium]